LGAITVFSSDLIIGIPHSVGVRALPRTHMSTPRCCFASSPPPGSKGWTGRRGSGAPTGWPRSSRRAATGSLSTPGRWPSTTASWSRIDGRAGRSAHGRTAAAACASGAGMPRW
jgi:hypothetical protein